MPSRRHARELALQVAKELGWLYAAAGARVVTCVGGMDSRREQRELAAGDVLWTDVSITFQGYCSDFGRTWVVGEEPTPRQHAQYHKWREIMDAGHVPHEERPREVMAVLTEFLEGKRG